MSKCTEEIFTQESGLICKKTFITNQQQKRIDNLLEALEFIQNVDGMQLDEKEYCFKKESVEVHKLIDNALQRDKELRGSDECFDLQ